MKTYRLIFCVWVALTIFKHGNAQTINIEQKLKGVDVTINKILKDWNVAGCGVGIVVKEKLAFANGYGYRNLEKKLPPTPNNPLSDCI